MNVQRGSFNHLCAALIVVAVTFTAGCDRASGVVTGDSPADATDWATRTAARLSARGVHVEVQTPAQARENTVQGLRATLARVRASEGAASRFNIGFIDGRQLKGQDAIAYLERQLHRLEAGTIPSRGPSASRSPSGARADSRSAGAYCGYIDGYSAGVAYDWSADAFSTTGGGHFGSGAMLDTDIWVNIMNGETTPYQWSTATGTYSAVSSGNMVSGMGNVSWGAPYRPAGGVVSTTHSVYYSNPETGDDCTQIMHSQGYY